VILGRARFVVWVRPLGGEWRAVGSSATYGDLEQRVRTAAGRSRDEFRILVEGARPETADGQRTE
jgi:hypothetical protein